MSALLHGFLVGLGFIIFLGPVFFYLLKNALEKGFWVGFFIALGIVIGDLVCIVICSLGAVPFFNNPDNQFWIGIIGSLILLGLGIKFLVKPDTKTKSAESPISQKISKRNYVSYFIQAFLINFVNPFVFVIWIGIIGYAETEYGYGKDMLAFFIAALLGIFSTDLLKAYFAHKIKKFLTQKFMRNLSRVFGVILIVFGVRVILYVFR
ncbi:MAG: LysE family translocator [Vicingaceae bacterium]|nr:LysE family translocator [Vicingaceae bacterium]